MFFFAFPRAINRTAVNEYFEVALDCTRASAISGFASGKSVRGLI